MKTNKMVGVSLAFLAAVMFGGCVAGPIEEAETVAETEEEEPVDEVEQAAQYGAYSQVSCNAYASTGTNSCTTGSIVPHSTDHWLRTRVNCVYGKASYVLYDTGNGRVVASGSCGGSGTTTSGWKTTYGLYGEYKLKVTSTAPTSAWGYVANCTSGCSIH